MKPNEKQRDILNLISMRVEYVSSKTPASNAINSEKIRAALKESLEHLWNYCGRTKVEYVQSLHACRDALMMIYVSAYPSVFADVYVTIREKLKESIDMLDTLTQSI